MCYFLSLSLWFSVSSFCVLLPECTVADCMQAAWGGGEYKPLNMQEETRRFFALHLSGGAMRASVKV